MIISHIPVLRNQLATLLSTVYTINDRTVQFVYPYHFPHISYTVEMCYLLNFVNGDGEHQDKRKRKENTRQNET